MSNTGGGSGPGRTVFHSLDSPLFEFRDADSAVEVREGEPLTAEQLLRLMRERVKRYGSPLPEGYVPPPGIDLAELLKRVPWPPPT
jgi:hypothetical protein